MDLKYANRCLEKAEIVFAPGLSPAEIQQIEQEYNLSFPPDLKDFLMFALPVSGGFVDWRDGDRDKIRSQIAWPYEGMCFDIEHNAFWLENWGERPSSLNEAFSVARRAIDSAPTLIPICGHRYIPDRPAQAGNLIFSVYQTDIIYYGTDLFDYFQNEFPDCFGRKQFTLTGEPQRIEFWSDMVDSKSG